MKNTRCKTNEPEIENDGPAYCPQPMPSVYSSTARLISKLSVEPVLYSRATGYNSSYSVLAPHRQVAIQVPVLRFIVLLKV